MRPQDPAFPSFSFVLSQGCAQPTPPSFVVFPWTSITYQDPVVPTPLNANPILAASAIPAVHAPNTLAIIIRAIRRFFAAIVNKLGVS
ncbi:hypothetical protein C8R44DRAFT_867708 [Mycena epipterygia]|nr:hypothetical protein C8R44DRAFT_867708 [Mycena epipterygia]